MPADDLLPAAGVAARDQPLLAALVFGALRWHYRLEWQAAQLLTRPLERDQAALAALLRIGLLQLQELRIPEHAAVSATVDATAVLGLRSARGLVNAVLRRFQREREQLAARGAASRRGAIRAPVAGSSTRSAPIIRTIGKRLLDGEQRAAADVAARQSAAHDRAPLISTSSRRPGLAAAAAPDVQSAVRLERAVRPSKRCRGSRRARCRCRICRRSMPRALLELDAGQRVLDACAAPGGKTGHILEAMAGRGEVWAVDRDRHAARPRARQPRPSRPRGDARGG